ncbi:hypothetical protein pqer_cds_703 [Pandoravirus quercus]|uniref:Uncharacterized protein n=1 Tax=Pandoravirus quercus TaxID=2107709 RepID=A0A2U7U9R3_9VIRU|nr:hypothetical protein pqer_cds_703 [Pandoravirus quercus]AVK75125.1 hypothetical protein pqer_cds_703 [Pandoravirus quercus]
MKKSSNTSDSTPTTASPRAFVGDTYDWPNFVKYKSGTTLEKADDLAQVHFCIENRATFPARRGWTAAVIKRQCGPVWKDMDEGKLGTTLRKKCDSLCADSTAHPLDVEQCKVKLYTAVGEYKRTWSTSPEEWVPPESDNALALGPWSTRRIADFDLTDDARERVDLNWVCARVHIWSAPYGTQVAIKRYCSATRDERTRRAGMTISIE